jgi:hypothetical protein
MPALNITSWFYGFKIGSTHIHLFASRLTSQNEPFRQTQIQKSARPAQFSGSYLLH